MTFSCGRCLDRGTDYNGLPCDACRPEERNAAIEKQNLKAVNIPARYLGVSVAGYAPVSPSQRQAKESVIDYVRGIEKNIAEGIGLTFCGPTGTGKTHLAVAVLMAARKEKFSIYFATEDGIFDRFKSEWNDPSAEYQFLQRLQKVRLLAIDDLGIRRPTDYVSDRYEAIFNTRYANGLPTIITTNKDIAILSETYPRQMSRLGSNPVLKIVGPDARVAQ